MSGTERIGTVADFVYVHVPRFAATWTVAFPEAPAVNVIDGVP
jgi:hypothetical protein